MNYITNKDHISTTALYDPNYLIHGLSWGSHRYVRREGSPGNYRYIYPEDLRNVGQNLVSGAKNLVTRAGNAAQNASQAVSRTARNAGQAVGRAIGTTQRASYQRAESERKKWSNVYNKDARYGGIYSHDYQGGFSDKAPYQQPSQYVTKNLNRAYDTADRARKEYKKTPLGKLESAAETIKDLPSDIAYYGERFLRSDVGIGQRKDIDRARDAFTRARNALDRSGAMGSEEWRRNAPAYDEAYRNYRDSISKYGKTFLGSIEGLLNTQYSKMQLSRASYGSGTVIPETVLKENIITETIIPEKKIYERRN